MEKRSWGGGINEFHLRGIGVKWQLLSTGCPWEETCSHTYQALPQLERVRRGKALNSPSTFLPFSLLPSSLPQALWQA